MISKHRTGLWQFALIVLLPLGVMAGNLLTNPHGELSLDCMACHTTENWQQLRVDLEFDHDSQTSFALEGVHQQASCRDCHVEYLFIDADSHCFSCHTDIHENQFGTSCEECHSPSGWFDEQQFRTRHLSSRFPLSGVHASLDCQACHASGQYTTLPFSCAGCHLAAYTATINPDHEAAQFESDCSLCHLDNTPDWQPVEFTHTAAFTLTQGHNIGDCNACHSEQYAGLAAACFGCHQTDYLLVDDPNHVAGGFPEICETCHTTSSWSPASFDHDQNTDFTLEGAHQSVSCVLCHLQGVYAGTPDDCWSCHEADYLDVQDPDHGAGDYPQDCRVCHNLNAWTPSDLDHDQTGFPLTGEHLNTSCIDCHTGGYSDTPTACFACHEDNYDNTVAPDHTAAGFAVTCEDCHTTAGWEPADWSHNDTGWPLTGSHLEVNCTDCHIENQYSDTPTACFACHEDNYDNTVAPDHTAAGFAVTCEDCHTTAGWEPADWSHNDTGWPLTGSHLEVNCADCHIENQYSGTPAECFFCHEDNYNNATDPNHPGAGFPTTCEDCHNTVLWEDADFDHLQWFPIYTGSHEGEWSSCNDCHLNPNDFTVFSCIDCHEHNQADMADEHDGVTGYLWESAACYECHPDGEGERRFLMPLRPAPELEDRPF